MKKAGNAKPGPEMLREYDFRRGTRGRFARRYAQGVNVVVLDPDVAKFFPDPKAVNKALRALMEIARRTRRNTTGHG